MLTTAACSSFLRCPGVDGIVAGRVVVPSSLSSSDLANVLSSEPSCTYVPLSIKNDTIDFSSTTLSRNAQKSIETFRTLNSAPRTKRFIAFITAPGSVVFSSCAVASLSFSSSSLFSFCARSISKTFSE